MTTSNMATINRDGLTANDGDRKNSDTGIEQTPLFKKDIVLNIGLEESFIRFIGALFIPWPFLLIIPTSIFYIAPAMFYLQVTGLLHFDPVKFAISKWFNKTPQPEVCDFAKELHIGVEMV